MLDLLVYVNAAMVVFAMIAEVRALRYPGYRFARFIGIAGMFMLLVAYLLVIVHRETGISSTWARPGLLLLLASLVARNLYYEFQRR